jgi:tRNA A37 threonylcarbamoyltransferase TsaD
VPDHLELPPKHHQPSSRRGRPSPHSVNIEICQSPSLRSLTPHHTRQARADIAACFQRVAVLHLEQRTRRALEWTKETYPDLSALVVAGGVASNLVVRERLPRAGVCERESTSGS